MEKVKFVTADNVLFEFPYSFVRYMRTLWNMLADIGPDADPTPIDVQSHLFARVLIYCQHTDEHGILTYRPLEWHQTFFRYDVDATEQSCQHIQELIKAINFVDFPEMLIHAQIVLHDLGGSTVAPWDARKAWRMTYECALQVKQDGQPICMRDHKPQICPEFPDLFEIRLEEGQVGISVCKNCADTIGKPFQVVGRWRGFARNSPPPVFAPITEAYAWSAQQL